MLTSFIDGRLRLRHPALKNAETLALVERMALGLEGVRGVAGNPRTGSLLLTYDPAVLSRETLLETAEGLRAMLPEQAKAETPGEKGRAPRWGFRQKCRAEAGVLGALMSITTLSALYNRRLHVAAGALLLVGGVQHLLRRRNRL